MRFASTLAFMVLLLVAAAFAPAAEQAAVPQATSLIMDPAGVLSDTEREHLLERLQSFQRGERAQIGVLIASGTGNETLAEYSLRVAETWQLGRASRDDGLLIVVVPSPAGARIEVGYGLEGAIPDARASRWIDELLPLVREKEVAKGLNQLLDQIDATLPPGAASAGETSRIPDNPEWGAAFALVIFSLFAVMPLFFGPWGCIASGLILGGMLGAAALIYWDSRDAGIAVGATAFVTALLWGLNYAEDEDLPAVLRYAKLAGNAIGIALFFSIVSLFVGVGLWAMEVPIWPAFVFSGLLSIGLGAHVFPGISDPLMVVLRSACHFVFILVVVYVALGAFIPDPSRIAFIVAAFVTASAGVGLWLDSRERRGLARAGARRWSLWFFGAAFAAAVPFALLALLVSIGGEDFTTQVAGLIAGGGSLAGVVALAARLGLIAAVKAGLGGRFGGGGAGRSD